MLPVLGREVVEGEQRVAILDQTLDRLVVFDAPGLDEGVEGRKRILLGFGHPDFLQRPFGFRLLALRQLVEAVGGFVHPATLAARLGPSLFEGLPEPERAIGDRELGANRQPTPLQIEEQFPPRLRTLAHTVGEADELLPALGGGSDDDQQALRAVFETGLHMNGAQNLGQRIAKSSWLRELENISVGHGVSLLCWRSGGLEHPHDTPPYPFTPSPTFAHSSTESQKD